MKSSTSALILVGSQIGLTNKVQSISSQEQALSFISNPITPSVLRVRVTQQVIQQLPAEVSVPATLDATYTAEGVEFDPLIDLAWVLRSRYFLGVGDIPAAEAAAEEAPRVQALYPEGSADPALVETLVNDIALAKEQE